MRGKRLLTPLLPERPSKIRFTEKEGFDLSKYNLVIPDVLMDQVRQISTERECSLLQTFKDLIKWGLRMWEISRKDGVSLIIRKDGQDKEIIMF